MKTWNLSQWPVAFLFCLVGAWPYGCSTKVGNPDKGDEGTTQYTSSNQIFTSADQSGPKITPSATLVNAAAATWSSGHVLYEIYGLIREYKHERDNGVIDGSNMYKAIHDAGMEVDRAYETCASMTEEQVTVPYDFGDEALTDSYNCWVDNEFDERGNTYHQSFAVHKAADGETYRALIATTTIESGQTTRRVVQSRYDPATENILVNQAYLVDYEGDQDYAVRLHLDGNAGTGLFTLKLSKGPGGGDGGGIAISGHGYNTGSYYLFRVTTSSYSSDVDARYYCFESDTTVDEMKLLDDAGSATIPENCASFASGLPATDYNGDGSSAPGGNDAFTGGGDYGTTLQHNGR